MPELQRKNDLAIAVLTLVAAAQWLAERPVRAVDLSPRNANYTISVSLDPETKLLEGRQVVLWRNIQNAATGELRFHLYWNAWRNDQSTWLREDRYRGRSDRGEEVKAGDWSYCEVDSIHLLDAAGDPGTDLTPTMRFVAPDDGNQADRTVFKVDLPEPVAPGESVEVELVWRAKVPRTFARTGFRGDYFFLAQWFPKLAVFENGRWNANQFHAATEFYSDYGVYDVEMTVPEGWVLGATGREVERRQNQNGTVTHRYQQDDVHAFTWTTSPDYVEFEDRFEEPGLPGVELRLLMQPEHVKQKDRHFEATKAALRFYGGWFGAYPYDHVTVVDPAYGSGAGGMEYPTLFTAGTRLFNPFGGGRPEGVTIHEMGHQFWYGVVGNNEFDYAWIDEGLNSFSDARVYDETFGDSYWTERYFAPPGIEQKHGFFVKLFGDIRKPRAIDGNGFSRYREMAVSDVPTRPTWRYHPKTASGISYSKSAIWLHTLERTLGWETLRRIMSTFYERWRFRHPTDEDFFAIASEVAGQDLEWFFDEVVREAHTFDYGVQSVSSAEIAPRGYFERDGSLELEEESSETDDVERYESQVVVRRYGSGVFPVRIRVTFEDGTETYREWDGRYRWKRFDYETSSRLVSATVDPERVLLLDLNYTNNSRALESGSRWPAFKWAGKWMIWLQDLMHTMAFFA
ncbi:MAG: M1 family metallopeptidase [Acidobacteria bacterium]|nr:M1 family metallopeptidase [Acidobacteriota bacterium]